MRRWLLIFFAVLLPLQFAWSAASAYCQHESGSSQARHIGHHFHAHQGEVKKAAGNPLSADADCAACQAASTPAITADAGLQAFTRLPLLAAHGAARPFESALARAPDRPQWLRLV
ncbi:hypothetical protein BH11PSE9_BH11PSE9_09880 [soil metagenome]